MKPKRKETGPSPELATALDALMKAPGMPDKAEAERLQAAWQEETLTARREGFRVKVEPSAFPSVPGELKLRVSPDGGYFWETINLLPEQIPAVIAALQRAQAEAGDSPA